MEFEDLIRQYAEDYDIPYDVAYRLFQRESNFDPTAVGGIGEIGLGQIRPSTAANPGFGVEPIDPELLTDPEENIRFTLEYADALRDYFGSLELGLAAYNAGAGRVEDLGGVPEVSRDYVADILAGPVQGPPASAAPSEEASADRPSPMGLLSLAGQLGAAPRFPSSLPTTTIRGRGGSGTSAIGRLGARPLA